MWVKIMKVILHLYFSILLNHERKETGKIFASINRIIFVLPFIRCVCVCEYELTAILLLH